jgi:hypothetical protein
MSIIKIQGAHECSEASAATNSRFGFLGLFVWPFHRACAAVDAISLQRSGPSFFARCRAISAAGLLCMSQLYNYFPACARIYLTPMLAQAYTKLMENYLLTTDGGQTWARVTRRWLMAVLNARGIDRFARKQALAEALTGSEPSIGSIAFRRCC